MDQPQKSVVSGKLRHSPDVWSLPHSGTGSPSAKRVRREEPNARERLLPFGRLRGEFVLDVRPGPLGSWF